MHKTNEILLSFDGQIILSSEDCIMFLIFDPNLL